jgi:hypothetical protein
MAKADLTAQRLRELLHYNPDTGVFTRLVYRVWNAPVGPVKRKVMRGGHQLIGIDGEEYLAHRLAWLYIHGTWPGGELDHINGDPADNRFCNLRTIDKRGNGQNRRRANKNSKSGYLGVSWRKEKKRWTARITIDGTYKSLGCFSTAEDAYAAYLDAKRKHHPYCTI